MNQKPPYDPLESLDTLYRAIPDDDALEYWDQWSGEEVSPIWEALELARKTLDYYVWTPERIRGLRNDAELSQVAFAARLGIATNTLRSWEQAWYTPNPESRELLRAFESRMKEEREQ